MKDTSPSQTARRPPTRRRRSQWPIVSAVLAVFAALLLIAGSDIFFRPDSPPANRAAREHCTSPPQMPKTAVETGTKTEVPQINPIAGSAALIGDDGRALWASPTAGPVLDLSYLPPGVQFVVALRVRDLLGHAEAEKILAALGPAGEQGVRYVEHTTGLALRDIERLTVAVSAPAPSAPSTSLVVIPSESISSDSLRARLDNPSERQHANHSYLVSRDQAYYLPSRHAGTVLVVAAAPSIEDIIELGDARPPLRRDTERLLIHTDADRHVTVLFAPNFLFGEGQGVFSGTMAPLHGPLFWFLGDEFNAAALSLHWDENFFVELAAVPTADTRPERAARILAERVAQIPDRVEEHVLGLDVSPYARRVVSRFPAMIRKLATYSRSEFGRDHAVVRAYLPVVAGHNLLMGAELTLAESSSRADTASSDHAAPATDVATAPAHNTSESAATALQKKTSLRFARDTLEAALEQLSHDIGIEIVIRGADLQTEGITKNQSFGIDLVDQPAEQILLEILRQANPDKAASGPADERQKLVYVLKPQAPDGPVAIQITTRAAAAQRGDELPKAFLPDK